MFLFGKQIFCFVNKHLKAGLYNGVLRATLALSRVGSDASYTVIPHLEGNLLLKVFMPLYSCLFPPQLEKCHQFGKIFAQYYMLGFSKLSRK